MGIVDREDWNEKRAAFLRQQLEGDLSDEQRAAVEKELEELNQRRPRWRRWLWPVRLPHER